jgi:hypothetical protein
MGVTHMKKHRSNFRKKKISQCKKSSSASNSMSECDSSDSGSSPLAFKDDDCEDCVTSDQ